MTARIAPVTEIAPLVLERAEAAAGGAIRPEAKIYRTLATYPDLMAAWLSWGRHVVRGSTFSPVLRELVVLRVALLGQGRYPLTQHVRIARAEGVDDASLLRVSNDPTSSRWDAPTASALCAVDQLHHYGRLDDRRWNDLVGHHGVAGAFDLIAMFTFFRMACWMFNTCRTPLDDGQEEVELAPVTPFDEFGEETLSVPRVEPLPLADWPPDLLAATSTWPRFAGRPELRRAGVYRTLANRPPLFGAVGLMMAHLLVDNTLTDPQREIVIVRSCLHDRGAYPYRQHVAIAAAAGVNPTTLSQLSEQDSTIGDPADAAIVAAVDELHRDNDIGDSTWTLLTAQLEPRAIMDLIVTAGFYGLISLLLNASGTKLEPGNVVLPARPVGTHEVNP